MISQPVWLDGEYAYPHTRPELGISLIGPHRALPISGVLVDTGADHTTLPRAAAALVGLDLRRARTVRIYGITGVQQAHRLNARLAVDGRIVAVPVTFIASAPPVLGRSSMFALWKDVVVGIDSWGHRDPGQAPPWAGWMMWARRSLGGSDRAR